MLCFSAQPIYYLERLGTNIPPKRHPGENSCRIKLLTLILLIKYPVASYGVFSYMIPPSCKVPQQAAGYERIIAIRR